MAVLCSLVRAEGCRHGAPPQPKPAGGRFQAQACAWVHAAPSCGRGALRVSRRCFFERLARPALPSTPHGAGQALQALTCWGALCVSCASVGL
jgi:hypothetical protein